MLREQTIGQLKRAWIQFEIAKKEKTNELWTIEAQIEKIKLKLKSYGLDSNLEMDRKIIAVWESASVDSSSGRNSGDAIRDDRM